MNVCVSELKRSMYLDFLDIANKYYFSAFHPVSVANNFETLSDKWIVALFHDLLEDTCIDPDVLFKKLNQYNKGYLFKDIVAITRVKEETYLDYIRRLEGVAKIKDIEHNLSRFVTLKPSLKKGYEKALEILN